MPRGTGVVGQGVGPAQVPAPALRHDELAEQKDRVAHVNDFLDAVRRVAAGGGKLDLAPGTDHRRVLAVLKYLGG
jgi:hypothetical protein